MRLLLGLASIAVTSVWTLLLWFRLAGHGPRPRVMQAMKLQLVGFYDGRPIGMRRVFLRGSILWLLSATGIGLVIMLILMVLHPRQQGWHDQAAKAVMIKQRTLAPGQPAPGTRPRSSAAPPWGLQQGYPPAAGRISRPRATRSSSRLPQQYHPQYTPQQVPSLRGTAAAAGAVRYAADPTAGLRTAGPAVPAVQQPPP